MRLTAYVFQSYDSDIHSPNDMVVDAPEDIVVQPAEAEKDEIAIINPDQLDNDADHENITLATDCTFLGPMMS